MMMTITSTQAKYGEPTYNNDLPVLLLSSGCGQRVKYPRLPNGVYIFIVFPSV